MGELIRKKIKWPTKSRKCRSRKWKSKWVVVYKPSGKK